MKIRKYSAPAFNLSLRSLFHLFVSGSLFYFAKTHFNLTLPLGIFGAFLTAVINEAIEAKNRVENSFHTTEVFKRDRLLATLVLLFTTVIVKLHLLFATLLAPISLIALTSYIDKGKPRLPAETRNLIKPIIDVLSITLGPIACVVLLQAIKIN